MLDRCPHRAAALSQGRMTAAGNLQCAYHGKRCMPCSCIYEQRVPCPTLQESQSQALSDVNLSALPRLCDVRTRSLRHVFCMAGCPSCLLGQSQWRPCVGWAMVSWILSQLPVPWPIKELDSVFTGSACCVDRVVVRWRDRRLHKHPPGVSRGHHLGAYLCNSVAVRRVPGHCVGLPQPWRTTLYRHNRG